MNLSALIIYKGLKEIFPEAVMYGEYEWSNELILSMPLFYSEEQTLVDGHVYIVSMVELLSYTYIPKDSLFICTATIDYTQQCENISAIVVKEQSLVKLYNAVFTIFKRYSAWDNTMRNLLLKNAPLSDYISCSLSIIANPMIIHDTNWRYLARAGENSFPDNYKYYNRQEVVDPSSVVTAEQLMSTLQDSKKIIHSNNKEFDCEFITRNLFDGNTVVGILTVSNHAHSFRVQDPALIEHLVQYLEMAFRYSAYTGQNNNQLKNTILGLLNGKEYNDAEIRLSRNQLFTLEGQVSQKFYCMAVLSKSPNYTLQYIAYQLEAALPKVVAVPFKSMIVVLYCANASQTWVEFSTIISTTLIKLSVQAGCSDAFEDFYTLYDYYKQASAALIYGTSNEQSKTIYRFKDYALKYFFQNGCSVIPARLICADCIIQLAERDKNSSVSYCESLIVYLDTGRNATETARRLNIKRNTFLARLDRIIKLLDLDLENPEERMYIEISLNLLKI
ncbi:Purine catabolism regulatory protein [compost metagenome]